MKAGLWKTQKTRNYDFTPMILSFSWPKHDAKAPKGSNKDMETRLEFTIIRQEIADTRLEFVDTRLEFADTRLEFVDTRLEFVDTRLEFADTRLEFVDTRLEFTIFRQDIAIIRSYFWGRVRKFVFRVFGYVLVWGCFFD